MRLLAAVALGASLSGCFGMCGLSPSMATWADPTLFEAMPPPGMTLRGVSTWTDPAPGLPFTHVVDPAWGPMNLSAVERQTPVDRYEPVRVTLTPTALVASRVNATPEAAIADAAESFLANATSLGAQERQGVVADLLASRHDEDPGYMTFDEEMRPLRHIGYQVPVPAGLRLDGLYDDLERVGALQVGMYGASAGPWAFSFSLASRELQAVGGRLVVGPTGEARFEGLEDGERSEEDYEADVRAWLAGQGVPAPVSMDVSGAIC